MLRQEGQRPAGAASGAQTGLSFTRMVVLWRHLICVLIEGEGPTPHGCAAHTACSCMERVGCEQVGVAPLPLTFVARIHQRRGSPCTARKWRGTSRPLPASAWSGLAAFCKTPRITRAAVNCR